VVTATAIDVRRRASFVGRGLRTVPGLCLLFAIGYAGKSIETFFKVYGKSHHLTLPNTEYVLWAILIGLVVGNVFGKQQLGDLANLSRWAFLFTFAGVGLRTNFAALRRQGARPLIVGAIGEVAVAVVTLGMVLLADRWFQLG
jgi:uncharacterized membrane protein YadS